ISHAACSVLGESSCSSGTVNRPSETDRPFTPIALADAVFNAGNAKYSVLVFDRPQRQEDAERIVGAFRSYGYTKSDGVTSPLDEVVAPDKRPGTTLIKTNADARGIRDDLLNVVNRAIVTSVATNKAYVSMFPDEVALKRGDV